MCSSDMCSDIQDFTLETCLCEAKYWCGLLVCEDGDVYDPRTGCSCISMEEVEELHRCKIERPCKEGYIWDLEKCDCSFLGREEIDFKD